mgnify:FL=1
MADHNKKPKLARRFRYTDQYKVVTRTAPDGSSLEEVEYIGAWVAAQHPEKTYRKAKSISVVTVIFTLFAILLLLSIQSFSVYPNGLYTLVPVTMAAFPEFYAILGILRLPRDDRRMQQDGMHLAQKRIKKSSVGILILLAAALLLSGIFFLTSGIRLASVDILFFGLLFAAVLCNGILLKSLSNLQYREEKES